MVCGELGAGTNRLNVYTVRKATQGLAKFIEKLGEEAKKRVVVAYDSRHKSPEFAMEVAATLGAHGITTYVFESLRPTPVLFRSSSFTYSEWNRSYGKP